MPKTIRLDNMLPNVFRKNLETGGNVPSGEIWQNDFIFEKGKRYLIEAASGTGKSSLCAYIMGMRKDFEGTLYFDDENSNNFSSAKWSHLRQTSLSWMPQEMGLFQNLTLIENLKIKNNLTNRLTLNEMMKMIELLDLTTKVNTLASLLSIGQQQRVAFLRSLCQPADFFILDEPVSHLDEENNVMISDILDRVATSTGAGVIVTSVGNHLRLKNLQHYTL